MNSTQEEKVISFTGELTKDTTTGEDFSALSSQLVKLTVEAALNSASERYKRSRESFEAIDSS